MVTVVVFSSCRRRARSGEQSGRLRACSGALDFAKSPGYGLSAGFFYFFPNNYQNSVGSSFFWTCSGTDPAENIQPIVTNPADSNPVEFDWIQNWSFQIGIEKSRLDDCL